MSVQNQNFRLKPVVLTSMPYKEFRKICAVFSCAREQEGPQRYTMVFILDGYSEVGAHAFHQIKISHKSDSFN